MDSTRWNAPAREPHVGIAALAFAVGEVRLVFWFVLFAWSGLGCAFAPVVLCSLFWRRTTRQGAIAGMIAGFVTAVVWVIAFKARTWGLYEMIPGFVAAFAVTVGVSLLTEPDPEVMAEYDEVRGHELVPQPAALTWGPDTPSRTAGRRDVAER